MTLSLYNYEPGNGSYKIDVRGTPYGSIYGNTAIYQYGAYVVYASTGNVTITDYTRNSLQGTFDTQNNTTHITGTFTAPN